MSLLKYFIYFITGGTITTAIIALEETGMPLLSRLAALFPIFTWLSYLFIANSNPSEQVVSHAKFVLIGTIISWIPYMLSIIYFTPKFGVNKAIIISMILFTIIALIYSFIYLKF